MRRRLIPTTLVLLALAFSSLTAQEPTNGNLRPLVVWVTPAGTAPYAPYASIPLEVSAFDPDGTIGHVVFWYQDGIRARIIGDVATPPYKMVWKNMPAGTYRVYALALDNKNLGQNTTLLMLSVGTPPSITIFQASPNGVAAPANAAKLQWTAPGASTLSIDQGVGNVTGQTSVFTAPNTPLGTTKTYTLTASNPYGSVTATTDVTVGLPVINTFTSDSPTITKQGATFSWSTSAARNVRLTPVFGNVPVSGSLKVFPNGTTTGYLYYQLTAQNAAGTTMRSVRLAQMSALEKISDSLYYSEHVLFIIPPASQVTWGSTSYNEIYSKANRDSFVATLKQYFPDDYMYVPLTSSNVSPSMSPNALTFRHLASGIGDVNITGVGVPNFTRYPVYGSFIPGSFGLLTHEAGHNWAARIGVEVGWGHWLSNSTANGQMADLYSTDGYQTVAEIHGDPAAGFTWSAINNVTKTQSETFNDQDLYLMGMNNTFPALHVLKTPVYNADHTMSFASVSSYDQAWVEQRWGVRSPSYRTSPKRMRAAFVYIARDLAEILTVAPSVEISATQWSEGEQIDTLNFSMQVPFLVATKYRGSFNARLADLDGNATPTLTITGPDYVVSPDGWATIPFVANDPDGPAPVVSCVPASANCSILGSTVVLTGLSPGSHFFTIKAQDAGGKKVFAHFVVDVQ